MHTRADTVRSEKKIYIYIYITRTNGAPISQPAENETKDAPLEEEFVERNSSLGVVNDTPILAPSGSHESFAARRVRIIRISGVPWHERARELSPAGRQKERGTEREIKASGTHRSRCPRLLPFKRHKSIMLRTLDIFSMIVIVPRACLARGETHYSACGATVAAVASFNRRMIYPVFGYPF